MGALAAKKAIIKFDILGTKTSIGEVRSFSVETSLGTIDVSTLSTDWKKYLVGQAGWTASMDLFYDPTDPGQEELVTRALAGTPCEFTFLPFGEDEVYVLDLGGATGGTFTLGDGDTIVTSALDHDATLTEIQTALRTAYDEPSIFLAEGTGVIVVAFPTGVVAEMAIQSSLTGGDAATCVLQDEPAVYVGTGSITAWSPSGATEDAVGVNISVQGDGELELDPA